MSTRVIVTAVIVMGVVGGVSAGPPPSSNQNPTALMLVVDQSWSCNQYEGDFRTLGRQAIGTLGAHDYLEIVAARHRATVALAHTIKTASAVEVNSLYRVLARIEAGVWADGDIAGALEVALARLTEICSKKHFGKVVTIVLSDGQIHSQQTRRILAVADRSKDKGWELYVTGTRSTSKDLLLAANQGRFKWSPITQANPGLWLARETTVASPSAKRPADDPNDSADEGASGSEPSSRSAGSRRSIQRGQDTELTFSGKIRTIGPPLPLPESVGQGDAALHEGLDTPAPEPNVPPGPKAEEVEERSSDEDVGSEGSSGATLIRGLRRYGPWIIAGLVLSALVVVAARAQSKAREWTRKIGATGKSKTKEDPGILRVTSNGQHYDLGPLERFHRAHVGKGEGNAIRLSDDSVEKQHVLLYGRRRGVYVQNTAKSPIRVNGAEVKPNGSRRLSFPADIDLNGKTKVRLTAEKKPAERAKERRADDDHSE